MCPPPPPRSDAACSRPRFLVLTALLLAPALANPARGHEHETGGTPHAGRPAAAARAAGARPSAIIVASLGGALQQAQQQDQFAAFQATTGSSVRVQSWDGTLATLQKRAASGQADWTLLLMDEAALRVACRQGLLLDAPRQRNPQDMRPDSPGQGCGVPGGGIDVVLAWDRGRVDNPPVWSDFWDVARRPGKRGLQRDPRGTLEIALMADGVAPGDVYRTLATSDGVDRAFRKLDQLKPYIVWWNTLFDAEQILESGAVLMTSAAASEIAAADRDRHRSFGTQPSGSLGVTLGWAVPRQSSPDQRAQAQRLLAFLSRAPAPAGDAASPPPSPPTTSDPTTSAPAVRPQAAPTRAAPPHATPPQAAPAQAAADQGATAQGAAGQGAAGQGAVDQGAPAAGGATPAAPLHPTLMMDDAFWAEHLVALRQRFDGWLGGR